MRKVYGFLLIDIMVVLAIIGILAALIVPSYQRYVLESYRLEASSELLRLSGLQSNMLAEHGFLSHRFNQRQVHIRVNDLQRDAGKSRAGSHVYHALWRIRFPREDTRERI